MRKLIKKISTPKQPTDTIQHDRETGKQGDHFPSPLHTTRTLPVSIPSAMTTQPLQHSPTHVSTSIQDKQMLMSSYPGIQKLELPVQKQDPYKFYKVTSSLQPTSQLHVLLNKYTTMQKAILIHEIFMHKT